MTTEPRFAVSPMWTLALRVYRQRDACYCDGLKEHAGWLVCVQREIDNARGDALQAGLGWKHQEHYRLCNCLDISAHCCDADCECRELAEP